jgi:hypothetical protein
VPFLRIYSGKGVIMIDISNLTDQEKSVLLVKVMGKYEDVAVLQVVDALVDGDRKDYWKHNGIVEQIPDLYNPAYMAKAWRVLNWAWLQTKTLHEKRAEEWIAKIDQVLMDYWCEGGDRAQRAWLDKIVELCIEAGSIKESMLSP